MKILMIAATAAAALAIAAPALADPATNSGVSGYGTLGYSDYNADSANLSAITGRIGARWGQYLGVEGELSGGLGSDHANVGGGGTASVHLNDQVAGYAVGFLPVAPNADLLARIGYGQSKLSSNTPGVGGSYDSWNYGVGGQYFFDGHNGVRADYTRENSTGANKIDANVWSLAYVRKF